MSAKSTNILNKNKSLLFNIFSLGTSIFWITIIFQIKLQMFRAMALTSDLAYYSNMLFNTGHGKFLYSDFGFYHYGYTTFLCDHCSPSLGLLVPFYKIFPSSAHKRGLFVVFSTKGQQMFRTITGFTILREEFSGINITPSATYSAFLVFFEQVSLIGLWLFQK